MVLGGWAKPPSLLSPHVIQVDTSSHVSCTGVTFDLGYCAAVHLLYRVDSGVHPTKHGSSCGTENSRVNHLKAMDSEVPPAELRHVAVSQA